MADFARLGSGKLHAGYGRLGLLALVAALHCPLVLAEDEAAKSNVASASQATVSWLSGGVGDEAMVEMRKVSSNYNVQLLLTGPQGNYLAGVPFTVSRRNGQVTVSGVTEGPLLYLKLPADRYQVAVQVDGAWQSRHIQASAQGQTRMRFVAKGE